MKNIHLIPTDKPSRLIHNDANQLCYQSNKSFKNDRKWMYRKKFNIYITSDEEIKKGDWFIWKDTEEPYIFKCIGLTDTDSLQVENSLTRKIGTFHRNPKDSDYGDWYRCYSKKIVLTTDQDLIKEGVQAIDDEFLEWFVKNPSCEFVEVDKNWNYPLDKSWEYKIIIPKEEQKQHLINMMKADEELGLYEENTKCYCGHTTYCDCGPEEPKQHYEDVHEDNVEKWRNKQETLEEEPKQITSLDGDGLGGIPKGILTMLIGKKEETLEEAAVFKSHHSEEDFIRGGRWQQERSYSKEEVLELLVKMNEWPTTFDGEEDVKGWFEQIKKN